jgi:integrase/recombinase XerD
MAKTKRPVFVPLPAVAVDALRAIDDPPRWFWTCEGMPKSAVADWQRTFRKLMKLAGVEGHPHIMRDTFAVRLLEKGVSIEIVAMLLGTSVRICEKHYSPWMKSRQDKLTADVKTAWA